MKVFNLKNRVRSIHYTSEGVVILNKDIQLDGFYDYNDVLKLAINHNLTEVTYNEHGKLFIINVDSGHTVEVNLNEQV